MHSISALCIYVILISSSIHLAVTSTVKYNCNGDSIVEEYYKLQNTVVTGENVECSCIKKNHTNDCGDVVKIPRKKRKTVCYHCMDRNRTSGKLQK